MATNSGWVEGLLDDAAAIVEAEWVRLQDEALWEDEVTDLFTDLPAPRAAPPRTRVSATTERLRSCPSRLTTGVGGRRGEGPRRRYGLPSGLLR